MLTVLPFTRKKASQLLGSMQSTTTQPGKDAHTSFFSLNKKQDPIPSPKTQPECLVSPSSAAPNSSCATPQMTLQPTPVSNNPIYAAMMAAKPTQSPSPGFPKQDSKPKEEKLPCLTNVVIKGKWQIQNSLGKGAFGEVYSAIDLETRQTVAVKVESPKAKKPVLKLEISVLRKLQDCPHIPKFYACGRFTLPASMYEDPEHPDKEAAKAEAKLKSSQLIYSYMVMQLLGSNLSDIRRHAPNGKFSLVTSAMLAQEMLRGIESLHKNGILHRDIKPGNFCIVKPKPTSPTTKTAMRSQCYLIDFGLSRRFMNEGKMREARSKIGFRGTARYASIAAHKGDELGMMDDLWSLFYVVIELVKGHLPWKGKEKERIGEMKMELTNEDLVQEMPLSMKELYHYLMTLKYEDTPDYEFIYQQFAKFDGKGLIFPGCAAYDWENKPSPVQDKPKVTTPTAMVANKLLRHDGKHRLSSSHDKLNHSTAARVETEGDVAMDDRTDNDKKSTPPPMPSHESTTRQSELAFITGASSANMTGLGVSKSHLNLAPRLEHESNLSRQGSLPTIAHMGLPRKDSLPDMGRSSALSAGRRHTIVGTSSMVPSASFERHDPMLVDDAHESVTKETCIAPILSPGTANLTQFQTANLTQFQTAEESDKSHPSVHRSRSPDFSKNSESSNPCKQNDSTCSGLPQPPPLPPKQHPAAVMNIRARRYTPRTTGK